MLKFWNGWDFWLRAGSATSRKWSEEGRTKTVLVPTGGD